MIGGFFKYLADSIIHFNFNNAFCDILGKPSGDVFVLNSFLD